VGVTNLLLYAHSFTDLFIFVYVALTAKLVQPRRHLLMREPLV
jgi:hypothetical protein